VKKIIAVLLLALFLCGCSNADKASQPVSNSTSNEATTEIAKKTTPEKEKITPSFKTETYETSFVKFDYPAGWFELNSNGKGALFSVSNWPDPYSYDLNQIEEVRKYTEQPLILLSLHRLDIVMNTTAKDISEAKEKYIDFSEQSYEIEVLGEGLLNDNIGVMECKSYGGVRIYHEKVYIYIKDNKIYCLELTTDGDNWDNIKEIVQVLEQSLEFSPKN
jgi:hypothetical protein